MMDDADFGYFHDDPDEMERALEAEWFLETGGGGDAQMVRARGTRETRVASAHTRGCVDAHRALHRKATTRASPCPGAAPCLRALPKSVQNWLRVRERPWLVSRAACCHLWLCAAAVELPTA